MLVDRLETQEAFVGDLNALRVICGNGQGSRVGKIMQTIEAGDFDTFEKMVLGRDSGRLNTWFVTRSQDQIRQFFEALRGQSA